MMDTETRVVRSPPVVADRTTFDTLLVEAIPLVGSAILRAAYVPPPFAAAGELINVAPWERDALEHAFVEAEHTAHPEYHDARHAGGHARDAAKGVQTYRPRAMHYRPGRLR